jgi:hypothetical protein
MQCKLDGLTIKVTFGVRNNAWVIRKAFELQALHRLAGDKLLHMLIRHDKQYSKNKNCTHDCFKKISLLRH